MNTVVRAMRPEEYPQLREFLYLSIFVHEGGGAAGAGDPGHAGVPGVFERVRQRARGLRFRGGSGRGAGRGGLGTDHGGLRPCGQRDPLPGYFLKPEYRGQGLGTALLGALLTKLGELGYRQASLSVQKANYAVKLYEKAGFGYCGTRVRSTSWCAASGKIG